MTSTMTCRISTHSFQYFTPFLNSEHQQAPLLSKIRSNIIFSMEHPSTTPKIMNLSSLFSCYPSLFILLKRYIPFCMWQVCKHFLVHQRQVTNSVKAERLVHVTTPSNGPPAEPLKLDYSSQQQEQTNSLIKALKPFGFVENSMRIM